MSHTSANADIIVAAAGGGSWSNFYDLEAYSNLTVCITEMSSPFLSMSVRLTFAALSRSSGRQDSSLA